MWQIWRIWQGNIFFCRSHFFFHYSSCIVVLGLGKKRLNMPMVSSVLTYAALASSQKFIMWIVLYKMIMGGINAILGFSHNIKKTNLIVISTVISPMHMNFLLSIQRLLFSYQDYWGHGGSLLKIFQSCI